jgi:hypothetical protein
VASTEKVSDQVKLLKSGFEISNHTFVNQITDGLQECVETAVPGLKVSPMGKRASGHDISLTIMGQITLEDEAALEDAENKVRQLMDSLKNPTNLLSLLGG